VGALDDKPLIEYVDRQAWRAWLEANHATSAGAWLVMRRREARLGTYEAAVEEALCYGWVDGTAGRVDDERGKLYFAPRKARSVWAASNKARIERLLAAGRMAPAGLAAVERAKANGSWTMMDSVDRLEVPADLGAALDARPGAGEGFAAWPPSVRKQVLGTIAQARRPETRLQRIGRFVDAAERNVRPF
jgi:uncharacterized protein YdeI (YjbR/CyaY-like superfamily)